jgi:FlaA1/EpsC-like NDP-sugar epimerase
MQAAPPGHPAAGAAAPIMATKSPFPHPRITLSQTIMYFCKKEIIVNKKRRILVTGAGGFLGKALVKTWAAKKNAEVIALCHQQQKCLAFSENPQIKTGAVDLTSPTATTDFLSKNQPEILFHLAAVARLQAGQQNPEKAVRVNLIATIHLLQEASRYGLKKFIFVSSDLARDAKSVVGITKLLMERYLQLFAAASPRVVVFRMPNLYDFPGSVTEIFARQIAENKNLSITDERMARRFITKEEAVSYLLYLMENGKNHQIYSIKQEPVFIKDLALKMIAESGKNLKLKIIGSRPGEKLYQASYSDEEAVSVGFHHLAQLKTETPSLEKIFTCIRKLPVSNATRAVLQNYFKNLF